MQRKFSERHENLDTTLFLQPYELIYTSSLFKIHIINDSNAYILKTLFTFISLALYAIYKK